ncbi:hypothetical protein PUN28_016812 [Cardiocondyla obscurior]|uniref:Uncharacterized protein n=1 Tax=Cardiocondyla obscurior TaxID=286306 RepID=A0AAW2ENV5_9HYME
MISLQRRLRERSVFLRTGTVVERRLLRFNLHKFNFLSLPTFEPYVRLLSSPSNDTVGRVFRIIETRARRGRGISPTGRGISFRSLNSTLGRLREMKKEMRPPLFPESVLMIFLVIILK